MPDDKNSLPSLEESCNMEISGEKFDNLKDETKQFIRILIPSFYKRTGIKIYLTSGWRPYSSNGSQHHMNGEAFDVAGDELNDVSLRNLYGDMAKATGDCTPLDEYYDAGVEGAKWWDGQKWGTSGDNFHITVHGSPTGSPNLDEKSQKVQDFINLAVKIANDNNPPHLYESGQAGPTNFDCTGFLSYCLNQSGYGIQPCHGSAFDTGVVECGFERKDYNDSEGYENLKPGDILSNSGHVELYIGDGKVVGAHSANKAPADQVSVESWYQDNWTEIYRFPGISGVTGPNGNPSSKFGPNSNAYMSNIKDDGHSLEIMPQRKTYCESVYPDYVYVAGNIPCSPLEKTLVNKSAEMDKVSDYNLTTSQDMKDLTGIDGNSFTGNKAMEEAQKPFDPKKCQLEVKVPSAGKPLNNNDPFPVDLKIEELERHLPRVKQYKIDYSPKIGATKETTAALLHVSDYTEKRLVRLENNMATLMRYIFAMGSRIAINCVYYGGQDHRSKYSCVRCLKDDRIGDGQVMQIDQCLSCSRYEPIIGQTYDIMNEVGSNLANIEDDMQMGYMNMDDYINFVRVEKMHKMKDGSKLPYTTASKRDENERDFKDQWEDGVKMSWKLTPVETQKPQINWRKDINSDDKSPDKLDSYQAGASQANDAPGSTLQAGSAGEWMQKHYDIMQDILNKKEESDNGKDSKDDSDKKDSRLVELQNIIKDGFGSGKSAARDALTAMKNNGYEQALQNACSNASVDPILAFALAAMETGGDPARGLFGKGDNLDEGIKSGMEAIKSASSHASGGNPIGLVQAFKGWNENLDKVNNANATFSIEWADACGDGNAKAYFPAVTQAYIDIKAANTGLSQMSTSISGGEKGATFPIASGDLTKAYFVQDYGASEQEAGVIAVSDCIVIKLPAGTTLYLPCDGSVSSMQSDDKIGNFVSVTDNSVGITYTFGGLSSASGGSKQNTAFAKSGEKLIIRTQDKNGVIDPKSIWQKLCNKVSTDKSLGEFIEEENKKMANTQ